MGILYTGGGVCVYVWRGNKGSGLDVGTPCCSSWIGTHATVCLSRSDIIAVSCVVHWHSQYPPLLSVTQLALGQDFPQGTSAQIYSVHKLIIILESEAMGDVIPLCNE